MPFKVEGGGFGTLETDLGRIAASLDGAALSGLMQEAAGPILEQMRANASADPHPRSGALRSALGTGNGSRSGRSGAVITIGVHRRDWSGEPYYPAYVEFGHGGPRPAPAHPFVRPAFEAKADEAYEVLRQGLTKLLK